MTDGVADPVYLDGAFVPLVQARISPLDRGFLFGDGAYEVVPVYSRRPFRLEQHLARLAATLAAIRLADPYPVSRWRSLVETLIAGAPWEDQAIYLQVTRGADTKRDHPFPPATVAPTVFGFASPLVTASAELRRQGVAAITVPDLRWSRCDLKVTAVLANVLARQQATDAGCAEAIFLRDGWLTEGTASNIFIVREGVVAAPPKGPLILPGVTYDVVLELAATHGLPAEVRPVAEADLRAADEVWMTSSTREILPITRLDGQPVGKGLAGPVAAAMGAWYQDFKEVVMRRDGRP